MVMFHSSLSLSLYIHTYIHTYIRTYIHVYMYMCVRTVSRIRVGCLFICCGRALLICYYPQDPRKQYSIPYIEISLLNKVDYGAQISFKNHGKNNLQAGSLWHLPIFRVNLRERTAGNSPTCQPCQP